MKLITLNTWMGGIKDPLLDFVRAKEAEIDVFCFQEVLNGGAEHVSKWWPENPPPFEGNLFEFLKEALPRHVALFHPNIGEWTGLAMFIRDSLTIIDAGDHFVHKSGPVFPGDEGFSVPYPKNIQHATYESAARPCTIINFHGLWNGGGKSDAPERIAQTKNILACLHKLPGKHVLAGDFNLLPDTESMRLLEQESGMRNLIVDFGVTSTRTRYYTRTTDRHADYVLVSPDVEVVDFKVLPDEVSDHSPLYLEFV